MSSVSCDSVNIYWVKKLVFLKGVSQYGAAWDKFLCCKVQTMFSVFMYLINVVPILSMS